MSDSVNVVVIVVTVPASASKYIDCGCQSAV